MSQQTHLHSIDSAPNTSGADTTLPPSDQSGRISKARSGQPLPSDRMKFASQLAVLAAVARTSGNSRRGMSAKAMSAAIDLSGDTGGLNSRFFRSVGWFEAVGRGEYTASAGLLAWNQHLSIVSEDQYAAAAQLRVEFKDSWVWAAVGDLLTAQPISIKLVMLELAKAAGASDHTTQLETVVEWMVWAGLINRDGDQLTLRANGDGPSPAAGETDIVEAEAPEDVMSDVVDVAPAQNLTTATAPATAAPTTDGAIVSFNLSVRLTADELRDMDQEQRDFLLAFAERLRG